MIKLGSKRKDLLPFSLLGMAFLGTGVIGNVAIERSEPRRHGKASYRSLLLFLAKLLKGKKGLLLHA